MFQCQIGTVAFFFITFESAFGQSMDKMIEFFPKILSVPEGFHLRNYPNLLSGFSDLFTTALKLSLLGSPIDPGPHQQSEQSE